MYNTGARESEVIGVKVADVVLAPAACVHLHGKGRKQRSVPLWRSTVKVLRAWLRLNPDLGPTSALLPNRGGQPMTRSNVTQRLALAVQAAARTVPSLTGRAISPHTLRHSTAMLENGTAPTRIDVKSFDSSVGMPLCLYSQKATYSGTGSVSVASSYVCQ